MYGKNLIMDINSEHILVEIFYLDSKNLRTSISVKVNDSVDNNFKDSAEVLIKKIGVLISKLKSRPFKQNVLLESLEKFFVDKFDDKLDSNPDLMGMLNGILRLENQMQLFDWENQRFISKSWYYMER